MIDEEILSLYKVADLVWCSDAPDDDQASGVFGRAIQTGVEPVFRKGSLPDRLLSELIRQSARRRKSPLENSLELGSGFNFFESVESAVR